jgi:DNA-binding IclR family transcriptional regulator
MDGTSPSDIQAVGRLAQILQLFTPELPELSVADAAERLRLNRTTVHRYLTSMAAAGLVEHGSRPAVYVPGRLLVQLGAFAVGQRHIVRVAPPYLHELTQRAGVTSVVSLWGPSGPVVAMVQEDAEHGTIVTVRVGSQLRIDSAQSIAFLAFLPDRLQVQGLLSSMPSGQQKQFRDRIAGATRTGLNIFTNRLGITVIAAPVFSDTGICATIGAVGTERMVPSSLDSPTAATVTEIARALTKEMGGEWPSALPSDGVHPAS